MPKIRRLATVVALGTAMALSTAVSSLLPASASSHKEAPLISQDPEADSTDLYAFVSPNAPNTVTLIANYVPFIKADGGPNFSRFGDDVTYKINVNNDGSARDNISYVFRFRTVVKNPDTFLYNTGPITSLNDPNWNVRQYYSVTRVARGVATKIADNLTVPPDNIGPRSTPNYTRLANQAIYGLPGGGKVFAGERDDPFYADLGSIFDLLGLRPLNSAHLIPLPTQHGVDGLKNFNVKSIILQVPITQLTKNGKPPTGPKDPNAVIGVYTEADRYKQIVFNGTNIGGAKESGPLVQVSRLGNPLVNEVLIPLGEKDHWNATEPVNDQQFTDDIKNPEPAALIQALYPGVKVPPNPRNKDIFPIFYTGIPGLNMPANVKPADLLRLNMAIPPTMPVSGENRLGLLSGQLDGFPNGRRVVDDVVDIELRALAGGTPFTPAFNHSPNNILTDGVDGNDIKFLSTFPYVPIPHEGYYTRYGPPFAQP